MTPAIEEARRMAADKCDAIGLHALARKIRQGAADNDPDVKYALAAIELGERREREAVAKPLRAKEVPCPTCKVDAGEMCRSVAARKPLSDPHISRNRLARDHLATKDNGHD